MRKVKIALAVILALVLGAPVLSQGQPGDTQQQPGPSQEQASPPPEKATAAEKDGQLPIHKEGWQFFLAPYLWIPGGHFTISHQGKFSGTVVADIPWYNLVPLLFSKAIGGMGRVEIWNGRWGLISDTNFIYIGESISAGGARELKLNPRRLPGNIPVRLQLSGDLKVWSRLLWQDVGVRYLVGTLPLKCDKPLPVLSFELFGGLRYTYYNQDTSLGLNATLTGPLDRLQVTRGGNLFDNLHLSAAEPYVGLRLGCWFTPKLNLLVMASCGGFGFVAYNNVDSVLEALVGYQVHQNIRLYLGYRGRYFSASGKEIASHGWFHGPALGTVFNF